jgi:branched-chain amino acid transport system substrate-binding protein
MPAGCTGNRACVVAHGGEPWACRRSDGQCVPIASEDCTAKFEPRDLEPDDTIWVGAMFPLKGPAATAFGQMNANGVDLARREISEGTRSLDGSGAAQRVRRIAVAMCDDSDDPMRAAKHLVEDVGVPAIVGFKSGQEVVDLAGSLLIKRGVLAIASLTASPLITKLPQPNGGPRMVWRTTYGSVGLATAAASFVNPLLESQVRAASGPAARVALVRKRGAAHDAFADAFFTHVVFNGKSALANGHDYGEFTVEDEPTPERIESVAADVAALAPSIIVMRLDDHVAELAQAIDSKWTSKERPRPVFLLPDNSTTDLDVFIGTSAERRHRVFAVESASETAENARFVFRYNGAFPTPVTRALNPASSYDALYLVGFASFALGTTEPSGASIARSFGRLVPPGAPVTVGPGALLDAVTALSSGGHLDVGGIATSLDFDSSGDPAVDFVAMCPDVNDKGRAYGDVESGLVFHAASATTSGDRRCP